MDKKYESLGGWEHSSNIAGGWVGPRSPNVSHPVCIQV